MRDIKEKSKIMKLMLLLVISLLVINISYAAVGDVLSYNKDMWASSCLGACTDGTGWSMYNINDANWSCGDLDSCGWISGESDGSSYIGIDLNASYTIGRITIFDCSHSAFDREPAGANIFYSSDNSTWEFLDSTGSFQDAAQTNITKIGDGDDFTNFNARYIRLSSVLAEGSSNPCLGELLVYEGEPVAVPPSNPYNETIINDTRWINTDALDTDTTPGILTYFLLFFIVVAFVVWAEVSLTPYIGFMAMASLVVYGIILYTTMSAVMGGLIFLAGCLYSVRVVYMIK